VKMGCIAAARLARSFGLAWASRLLRTWMRQRGQAARRTLGTPALKPSCASEITSCTSREPRRVSPNSLELLGSAGLSAFYTTFRGTNE
jgi:hypothetical protein